MSGLIGVWHKTLVDCGRNGGIPVASDFGKAGHSEEENSNSRSHGPRGKDGSFRLRGEHGRQAHGERILHGANGYTFETAGTFDGADLDKFVHGES